MNRKQKFVLNSITGVLKQLVTVICGFVLPRYMLLYYGSSVNGLVSSIAHFLSFISLLDMGVGAVIQSNLYPALAKQDNDQISRIVKSSNRFFSRLACIFLIYLAVLVFVFPSIVDGEYDYLFSGSLLVIIAVSTFAQYMFGMTYQLLLNADQKGYIPMLMSIGTILLNTILAIIMMRAGASIHTVKLMTSAVYVLRPVGQAIYVKKHYSIDRKIVLTEEPIKQKWNGFSQHVASVICENIDVVVLSVFSTLENISVYSVYFNVTNGINQIFMTAASGLESMFGNMIANDEKETLAQTFELVEWVTHNIVDLMFSVTMVMIVSFIRVYTRGINDADYIAPTFAIVLVSAYAAQCLRVPYFRVIKAAGHFKQTQNGAYVSALINIIITIGLVFKFGLVGVAMGTFFAMLYNTCYFVWYLSGNILYRPKRIFYRYLCFDIMIISVSLFMFRTVILYTPSGYLDWLWKSILVSLGIVLVTVLANALIFRNKLAAGIKWIKARAIRN